MTPEPESELELRDYLQVIRQRKWLIALAVVVVTGAALGSALTQTKMYQGQAQLLLQPKATESLFDPNTGARNDPTRNIQTEIQVLSSRPVQDAVRAKLGFAPKVSASPVGQTDVVTVSAKSTVPERAALIANTYATAYIDFRRKQEVDDLFAAAELIQAKVTDLQKQIDPLQAQINSADPKTRADVTARISPQLDPLESQRALFKQKLDQLQFDAALKTGGAQLVTPAVAGTAPVSPRPKSTAIVAATVGLFFGIGLAFLFEYLDDSIRNKDDLERASEGLSTLAVIPAVADWKDRDSALVISLAEPKSAMAEAYRALRTSIQFMGLDMPMRTIQFTSPSASEGKSTTLANLGVALALAGQRVVLVCCDLRRPRIHEFFGLSNEIGFTSVLLGDVPLTAALQDVPAVPNLRLLASGPPPPNPSELLSGRRTVEVLTALQGETDVVLIDCPPILPVTDAAVLSSRVDATIIVATAQGTTKKQMHRALEVLRQVEAPLVGAVLNGVSDKESYGYSYRYQYAYGSDQVKSSRRGEEPAPTSRA